MKLLLIGCGRLGRLFLERWSKNPEIKEIWVIQPSLSEEPSFGEHTKIHFVKSVFHLPEDFSPEVVVIAIKPQQVQMVLRDYQVYHKQAFFISLVAGVPIQILKNYLGEDARIGRLMPNIAIQVNASLNLAFLPQDLSSDEKALLEIVCHQSGNMMWLSEERLLDELTVISGSGPAYFFLLMEALVSAAMEQFKIEKSVAMTLVKQTFMGSALLIQENKIKDPKELRLQVTSKGGVTEAAVEVLHDLFFSEVGKAVKKGYERVKELSLPLP